MSAPIILVDPDHYTYKVTWSPGDERYVANVVGHPAWTAAADSPEAAMSAVRILAASAAAEVERSGDQAPIPLADQTFSGTISIELPTDLHRNLVREAAEKYVEFDVLVRHPIAR